MEREYIRKQMFSYDQATRQIRTMPEIFSPVVSCHNIAAVWVAFSPSGLHSSQDSSDIVVDRMAGSASPSSASGLRRPAWTPSTATARVPTGSASRTCSAASRAVSPAENSCLGAGITGRLCWTTAGYNGIALLNVDACVADNLMTLESDSLRNISKNIGGMFLDYGITPYWTVCYAAPFMLANISADPDNPAVERWWAAKAAEIKSLFLAQEAKVVTRLGPTLDPHVHSFPKERASTPGNSTSFRNLSSFFFVVIRNPVPVRYCHFANSSA